jgi:small ligand-binding sensory domain FIST
MLPDPRAAAAEAAAGAAATLGGSGADLVVVFAGGAHLDAPEQTLAGVYDGLDPAALIGCGASGVIGGPHEHEEGTAVAVWAATFGHGEVTPFHARVHEDAGGVALTGLPSLAGARGTIVLSDPRSFPVDGLLDVLASDAPGVPVLGGLASGFGRDGGAILFHGQEVLDHGMVGARLDGIEVLPCVSQGAAPLGREVTITAADGNVIQELAGAPALQTIEKLIGELTLRERSLVSSGLMLGMVIDGGKPDYEQGDFLVRGILGVDRDTGEVAVGALVRRGQVLRLHARDARSASEDLRRELGVRCEALAGADPAGALVFACTGRGRAMFGTDDHDAAAVSRAFGGAPSAGLFAAGEIGPVGGRSFLHGFTATIAVFPG